MAGADELMAAVRGYIAAFNDGDAKAMAVACADPMVILDGMVPHVCNGPTATQDWYRDVLAEGKHVGASEYKVTLGEPRHAAITENAGYVVVPATMTFKLKGKAIQQEGAAFTVAHRRVGAAWRLAAWAWSKGTFK